MKHCFYLLVILLAMGCIPTEPEKKNNFQYDVIKVPLAIKKGHFKEARELADHLTTTYTGEPLSYYWCGLAYTNEGYTHTEEYTLTEGKLFEKGTACYKKALEIAPDFTDVWTILISTYADSNQHAEAIDTFEQFWNEYELPDKDNHLWSAVFVVEQSYIEEGKQKKLYRIYSQLIDFGIEDKELQARFLKLKESMENE